MIAQVRSLVPRMLDRVAMMRARAGHSMLKQVDSVVHIGANVGQERHKYRKLGIDVTWVEADPLVFGILRRNIAWIRNQRALPGLVTDRNGDEYEFHVSSNGGKSSSIFELADHRKLWPGVRYLKTLPLHSVTLSTLLNRHRVAIRGVAALVLDTQGSELLVLRGARGMLDRFEFVTVEVPDFESYAGCCQVPEVEAFMRSSGFKEISRLRFANRPGIGRYFDITYASGGIAA